MTIYYILFVSLTGRRYISCSRVFPGFFSCWLYAFDELFGLLLAIGFPATPGFAKVPGKKFLFLSKIADPVPHINVTQKA